MPKEIVTTTKVAAPTNPFSLGVRMNGFLFTSGQVGKNLEGKIAEGFVPQVKQAMENLKAVVEAGGSSMDQVLKVTIFVTDISRMGELNQVYRTYFDLNLPARSTVEVRKLGGQAEVEIEAVASCA